MFQFRTRILAASLVLAPTLASPMATAFAQDAARPLPLTGTIGFIGSKVTAQHVGNFKAWSGTVALANGKPEGGKLAFTVQTGSAEVDVDNRNAFTPKLEEHLKSPDFFDVDKHPTATFTSTAITAGGKGGSHTVRGNLTLRGVTKLVSFPATITVRGKEVSGRSEFSINRKDFGIAYAGKADDLIRDGVVLKIDVKAARP